MGPPPSAQMASYIIGKRALQTLLECALVEYAQSGLRASAVIPTFTETPMLEHFHAHFLEMARQKSPIRGRSGRRTMSLNIFSTACGRSARRRRNCPCDAVCRALSLLSRTDLFWLPSHPDFANALKRCRSSDGTPNQRLELLQALANHNLDFVQTANVYRTLQPLTTLTDEAQVLPTIKLALLGSSTLDQILPTHCMWPPCVRLSLNCYTGSFNQYQQELLDSSSNGLYAFQPDVIATVLHEAESETGGPGCAGRGRNRRRS